MKQERLIDSMIVFAASFTVYLLTLCPTIYAGDSGDFITAAYTLGIPHPAGYPIYTIVGKLFTLIPYGNVAFRINLMNAVFTALVVALVYNTVQLLTKSRLAGIGTSLLLAFSYSLWAQEALGKAYSLNALFFSIIVYLAVLWRNTKGRRVLYYLAFTYGLALTNHVSIAFMLPAFIYFIWKTDRKVLNYDTGKKMVLSLILGLLMYIYIPLRASMKPAHNWGDPETVDRFLIHVTAYVHRHSHVLVLSASRTLQRFSDLLLLYLRQFSVSGAVVLIGLFCVEDSIFLWFSLMLMLLDSLYTMFFNMVSFDTAALGVPTCIVFSIWGGFGIKRILWLIDRKLKRNRWKDYAPILFITVLVLIPLAVNYGQNDQSRNRIAYYYGMDLLSTVENNSVIFAEGDNEVFILDYLLTVEKARPDVATYDINGFLSQSLYGEDYPWLPDEEHNQREDQVEYGIIKSGRPVYYTSERNMRNMPGYSIVQTGLLYKVVKENETLPKKDYWSMYDTTGFDDETIYKDYMTRAIVSAYHTRRGEAYYKEGNVEKAGQELLKASRAAPNVADIHSNLGKIYLEFSMYDKAIAEYNLSISLEPDNARSHNNLGYAYISSGDYTRGFSEYLKAVKIDPTYSTARFNLAGVLFERKDYDNALQEYLSITRYDPNYALPYKYIGLIYYNKGDYSNAVKYWQNFLTLAPEDVDAETLRQRVSQIQGSGNVIN